MIDYQKVLDSAFPASSYSNTIRAIGEGIALGEDTINGVPFLNTPVGKDIRGLVRRAAVMHRIHQLCEVGDLPFVSEFTPMPIGSWHWLELRSGQCRGYLVRTADKETFPEDTPNQQDKRHSNQPDLFDDPKVVQLPKAGRLTAWLCYGATRNGATTHVLWGLPSGKEAETWLARVDVLNAVRTAVTAPAQPTQPKVNPRDAMKFRDEVQQGLEARKKEKRESGDSE